MSIHQIMPWLATAPRDLTVLVAPSRRLTKKITQKGVVDYDNAMVFEPTAFRLDCIEDTHELLADLAPRADTCIIRGVLKREFAGQRLVLRRSRPRPGVPERFAPAARQWLMIEADSVPLPGGIDPTDPLMAGGAVRRALPAVFHQARCVVQLSSGAGIKPGLRVHLWFWLDRPISDAEAKRLLAGAPVDLAVYNPVQLHYCAAPIFDGVDDPCTDGRLAILPGYPEVVVPTLPEPQRPRATFAATGTAGIAGAARAEAYAQACLRNLALAPEGRRHQTCVAISCRLLSLAKAGEIDATRVAAMIKGVMVGKGFDGRHGRDLSEIDSILTWAWAQVEPEGLPHVR